MFVSGIPALLPTHCADLTTTEISLILSLSIIIMAPSAIQCLSSISSTSSTSSTFSSTKTGKQSQSQLPRTDTHSLSPKVPPHNRHGPRPFRLLPRLGLCRRSSRNLHGPSPIPSSQPRASITYASFSRANSRPRRLRTLPLCQLSERPCPVQEWGMQDLGPPSGVHPVHLYDRRWALA